MLFRVKQQDVLVLHDVRKFWKHCCKHLWQFLFHYTNLSTVRNVLDV